MDLYLEKTRTQLYEIKDDHNRYGETWKMHGTTKPKLTLSIDSNEKPRYSEF